MNTSGVDVSAWQGIIDWQKCKDAGAKFAIIKSSQSLFQDFKFSRNWSESKRVGMPRGAFHYLDWSVSAAAQARFFASLFKDMGEITPTVDYEETKNLPSRAWQQLLVFLQEFESLLGIKCMIYTSPGYWMSNGSKDVLFAQYPLWIAHWKASRPIVPAPWKDWAFWQYDVTGDGFKYGMQGAGIDVDYAKELPGQTVPSNPDDAVKLRLLWNAHPELWS